MPASKRELIMVDLKTVLEGITTGNGYNWDVAKVERMVGEPEYLDDVITTFPNPTIYLIEGIEEIEYLPSQKMNTLTIIIVGCIPRVSAANINGFIQDVRQAIGLDTQRGGNATSTTIRRITPVNERSFNHVKLRFEVQINYLN